MSDIFLSYKSSDIERAKIFVNLLEKQGWSVWWDMRIPPGRTFADYIKKALDGSKCVMVLWSKNSVSSNWVNLEASEGLRRKIYIPVLIDNVEIPFEFMLIEAAKLINWDGTLPNPEFELLSGSVREILSGSRGNGDVKKIIDIKPEVSFTKDNLIKLLIENRNAFNKFRIDNPVTRISFSNENLSGADLSNTDLSNIFLNGANMHKTDLSKANLSGAKLSEADLTKANLSEANLKGADLSGADLTGTNISKANMSGANLSLAYISRSNLSNADLSNANLSNANLSDTNLSNANISGSNLAGANLFNAKLNSAKLVRVKFPDSNLSGVVLSKADLSESDLSGTRLSEADLSDANLYNANLSGANLYKADLSNANLSKANLTKANLSEADLTNANLTEADLSDTNLIGANLFGGNLIKVKTSGVKVNDDLKAKNIKLVIAEDIDDRAKIKNALNDVYETFRRIILRDNDELNRVFISS